MNVHFYTTRIKFAAIAAQLLLIALVFPFSPKVAFGQQAAVTFTAQVPAAPAQMQAYKLAATPAPTAFLNEKLSVVKIPALALEQKTLVARGPIGAQASDKVRVYADTVSGDTHFIPNLQELVTTRKAPALPVATAVNIARTALTDARFIPKDVTQLQLADAIPVMGNSVQHGSTATGAAATQAQLVMTVVPAVRMASGLQVYGRGSHALISVANDQSITGALRRWRTASLGSMVKPTLSQAQVQADILRQLSPFAKNGATAVVDKITLAYYDGNANFMQPVYRFEATLSSPNASVAKAKIAGFVPIGTPLEPIPDLAAKPTGDTPAVSKTIPPIVPVSRVDLTTAKVNPALAKTGPVTANTNIGGANVAPAFISVGEFVNQDWPNNNAYIDMANNFLNGLNAGHASAPAGDPPFKRTLWWTAYSWQVNGPQSKNYMNAVNVAYTVPHGDWYLNTDLSNYGDLWYINKIGTGGNPGFGAAAGGKLATWVIMSCEVIPSYYDMQNNIGGNGNGAEAFTPWWPVFQGLHNVIGFRTIMFYPDDALNYGFAEDAAKGGDINAAWFHEVAAHDGNDGTYVSQHLKGNPVVHYDRASTMIDGRDLGQSIYNVGAQTASTTLWSFWMGN